MRRAWRIVSVRSVLPLSSSITLSAKVAVADERLDDRVLVQDAGGADDHAGQVSGAAQCIRYTGRVSRR